MGSARLVGRRWAALLPLPLAGLALALLFSGLPARAAGVVGTGTPQSCNYAALLAAINSGGGLITFNCGPAPHTIPITNVTGLLPQQDTTLDGGGLITLSGNEISRLFSVGAGLRFTLTQITLANGFIDNPGGAIRNAGQLVLDGVTVRDSGVPGNWGGGGIYNAPGASLVVRNSVLLRNISAGGGAVSNDTSGRVIIEGSQFISNTVNGLFGGAIYNAGVLTATNSVFSSNVVTFTGSFSGRYGGGALANRPGASASLFEVTLSDNTAAYGGALLNQGVVTITGGLVHGNSAYASGGGLMNDEAAVFVLTGTTVSTNTAAFLGGGLYSDLSVAQVSNAAFTGNTANFGGGAYASLGDLFFVNGTLAANTALEGGGAYINRSDAVFTRTLIAGNQASYGGGFFGDRGNLVLFEATVRGNTATVNGGGLRGAGPGGSARLDRTTVSGNVAGGAGGGLYTTQVAELINATFSGNTAGTNGGGIYNGWRSSFFNVTLSHNQAASGSALYSTAIASTTLTNTLLANSLAGGNCAGGATTAAKYSLSSDQTCALAPDNNQNGVDALLTELGDFGGPTQVHLPRLGSPAIDGVVGADAPGQDQRGEPRPAGGGYDIGAVERQPDDVELLPKLFLSLLKR